MDLLEQVEFDKGWNEEIKGQEKSSEPASKTEPSEEKPSVEEKSLKEEKPSLEDKSSIEEKSFVEEKPSTEEKFLKEEKPSLEEIKQQSVPAEKIKKEDYEQKWKSQQGIVKSLNEKVKSLEEAIKKNTSTREISGKEEEGKDIYDVLPSLKGVKDEFGEEIPKAIIDAIGVLYTSRIKVLEDAIQNITTSLNPLGSVIIPIAREQFENKIREVHPDFEKYRNSGEIAEWIETLPAYKKGAFEKAYYEGTEEEVVDLLNTFKAVKGYGKSVENTPKVIDEKKVKSMMGVVSKNPPIKAEQKSQTNMTFDDGWNSI